MQKNPMNAEKHLSVCLSFSSLSKYWPMALVLSALWISACTYDTLEVTPECEEALQVTIVEVQASACDQSIGLIEVSVTNSTDPSLEFSLDGNTFQPDGRFENLAAGTYTLIARTDLCETTQSIQVENAAGLNATLLTAPSACDQASGTISVTVSDAVGQVLYQLDEGTPQASPTFSNLAPGSYLLSVSDDTGCEVTLEAQVSSTIAYAEIESIISGSCAISGCHAGNVSPDFRVKENILNNANQIRNRTGNQSMPPVSSGESLTTTEIEAIACWVADGANG